MAAEGTGAVVAAAATVAMAPVDNSRNGGGRQRRWQAGTKAATGADNNQSGSRNGNCGGNGHSGSGSSSPGGNGGVNRGLGGANSSQGGGRCGCRRIYVD